jgi:long-chain acyl-CoA synthetase
MPLSNLIARSAERFPEKAAAVCRNESISFADLYQQSGQVGARLQKLGIGPGARVAILHENAVASIVFFWGALASGAQVVDIPCQASIEAVDFILSECRPAAIALSVQQQERFEPVSMKTWPDTVLMELPLRVDSPIRNCHSLAEIIGSESPRSAASWPHDSEVALIVYTPGATAGSKGVMLSHRNLLSNIAAVNSRLGLTSDDSILVVVPSYSLHGRTQLLVHALVGATVVFSEGFHHPQRVVSELLTYGVTGFSGTPYHFQTLLESTDIASSTLPDLRYVLITGAAMHAQELMNLSTALPGVEIHVLYGQTEASPTITHVGPLEVLNNPESSGRPLPGIMVQILAEDGSELPPGAIGEVVTSGANVMCGYVSGDEAELQKIDSFGRLHTGDIGKLDHHGHLILAGRKSDIIKSAGERVFPTEVEGVLGIHPAVRESAVLGIPDQVLGEKIVACVVLKPGAVIEADALRTHCLKLLPLVRVPREIRFTESLPKTESGKIDRPGVAAHFRKLGKAKAAR